MNHLFHPTDCPHKSTFTAPTPSGELIKKCLVCGKAWFLPKPEDEEKEPQRQQKTHVTREPMQTTNVRQNVHNLALLIGIRAAAREYGLKESRVLNWAWRDGWHIEKRKHRSHNLVNRCRLCGQPVISL